MGKANSFSLHTLSDFVVDSERVLPEFISWFLNSPAGSPTSRCCEPPNHANNINSEELRGLQIPLPPLSVQKQIMDHVAAGLKEITREREAADRIARKINSEVEALIFGHEEGE